jgi:hypothetical protein
MPATVEWGAGTRGSFRDSAGVVRVETCISPYDYWHDRYQAYYREGLLRYLSQQGERLEVRSIPRFPKVLALLRAVRNSSRVRRALGPAAPSLHRSLDRFAGMLGGKRSASSGLFHPLVGQYQFYFDGAQARVCLDASDSGNICSPELLEQSDVYLKTNYWKGRLYDSRVVPFYNGNPLILPHIGRLRSMRSRPPEYDFCFVVRVWGGRDEVEGVEHNIRLLEAAARAPGRKFLHAYLVAGDTAALEERLRKQGITCSTAPLPLKELWRIAAVSRLNMIRLGMHACVPWRMIDLLALGACPVLDQPVLTVWPEPMREGVHFLHLGAVATPGACMANERAYSDIPARLEQFLTDDRLVREIRANAADYFDRHLAPEAVGRCFFETVLNHTARRAVVP